MSATPEVPAPPPLPIQAALPAAPQFTDLAHLGAGRTVVASPKPKSTAEALVFLGAVAPNAHSTGD
jgi:hypothetical protein